MSDLITDVTLAEKFGVTTKRLHSMRRYHHWPCVKLGNQIRFTPEQVTQIVDMQTVTAEAAPAARPAIVKGQTPRSAARRRPA